MVIVAMLLTAHVAAARGITSKELIGTWIMGAAGADTVYGTFRSDSTYGITHGEQPWARGTWKLSTDGKSLRMTNAASGEGDTTVIRRLDGRLLYLTNGHDDFTWKRAQRRGHLPSTKRPNQGDGANGGPLYAPLLR
jgi:predicted lipoprotein with Yx(FWY)xxD motif